VVSLQRKVTFFDRGLKGADPQIIIWMDGRTAMRSVKTECALVSVLSLKAVFVCVFVFVPFRRSRFLKTFPWRGQRR
jgi:hypothetical protein